ncbi:hypothetical protein VB796_21625 [Arcicella sp. LKC2W]|uniref:hypothetical protein n=1 Tax=Arcicella sp. LKC2W TaxID=2984198 RepID=UPI002B21865F|nr:hypothetical protein [Arcicella sp. LKC2W]MEA5461683.1 hypothetical protein [Arcicella sp. LKC2W]
MKPSDFFISVTDFFSVLLPGAMLTWFLNGVFYSHSLSVIFPIPVSETGKWGAFLVVAYVLGNLIFMLASFLDKFYDKNLRKLNQKDPYDLAYKTARNIQSNFINSDELASELTRNGFISISHYNEWRTNPKREIINTFKWIQYYFQFKHPEALAEIKRTEADSKFFRSLVITFLMFSIFLFREQNSLYGTICFLFALLCFYRYGELRFKATEKAYQLFITYGNLEPKEFKIPVDKTLTLKETELKKELKSDFTKEFAAQIEHISEAGLVPLKQVVFEKGMFADSTFKVEKDQNWYCLSGKGIFILHQNNQKVEYFIQPNSITYFSANSEFSIANSHDDSLKFLVKDF